MKDAWIGSKAYFFISEALYVFPFGARCSDNIYYGGHAFFDSDMISFFARRTDKPNGL